MLLLVLQAEHHAAQNLVLRGLLEKPAQPHVHVLAVGEDLVERRAGEAGAQLLLRHVAECVVVAVEEPAEVWMERLVVGDELGQHEGLKEPGGMREVPLDRRGLRTGLHHHVLRGERRAEAHGGGADVAIAHKQGGGGGLLGQHGKLQTRFSKANSKQTLAAGWMLRATTLLH